MTITFWRLIFFRVFPAVFLLLRAVPVFAYSYADKRYAESVQLMREGKLNEALVGLMDVIVQRPDDPLAHSDLQTVTRMLIEEENLKIDRERARLTGKVEGAKKGTDGLNREKDADIGAWEELVAQLKANIPDVDDADFNLKTYLKLLSSVPVYSGMTETLTLRIREIREGFSLAIKARYPGSMGGKVKLATVDIVSAVFMKKGAGKYGDEDLNPRDDPRYSRKISARAGEIEKVERDAFSRLSVPDQALSLFSLKKYSASLAIWEKILRDSPKNPEAVFYAGLSRQYLGIPDVPPVPAGGSLTASRATGVENPVKLSGGPAVEARAGKPPEANRQPEAPAVQAPVNVAALKTAPRRQLLSSASPSSRLEVQGSGKPSTQELISPKSLPPDTASEPPGRAQRPGTRGKKAGRSGTKSALFHYQEGIKQYAAGNLEKAISSWEKCLELEPDNARAKRAMDRARNDLGARGGTK